MSSIENAQLLQDSVDKALADLLTPELRQQAQQGEWPHTLWPKLVDLGLPLLLVDETQGGSGATLAEAFGVISSLGQYALPCPLAETILANKLLTDNGLSPSEQPLSLSTLMPNLAALKLT